MISAIINITKEKEKVKIMLITEKKIIRTRVELDKDERDILREVNRILFCIQDMMTENDADEMISLSTGEVIERDELSRLRGIIGGLLSNNKWELK